MRKLAMLTMAMLGLTVASNTFAQGMGGNMPSQAGPQPGLPAGVGGGINSQAPATTGNVQTTPIGPQAVPAPAPMASQSEMTPAPAPVHRRVRRRRTTRTTTHRKTTTPAATTAPATNQ